MKKAIREKEQKNVKSSEPAEPSTEALPQYLLDRSTEKNAKALSSAIKQKRNEKVQQMQQERLKGHYLLKNDRRRALLSLFRR